MLLTFFIPTVHRDMSYAAVFTGAGEGCIMFVKPVLHYVFNCNYIEMAAF